MVTDSTADIPKDVQQALDITVVPLNVHIGEEVFRDRVDLSGDEFFRRLGQSAALPKTSQPSVGAFEETYRGLLAQGHDVVAVLLSARVSGTYNAGLTAAQAVAPDRIEVIDSQMASMALGFLVLEGARLARAGKSRREVADHVRALVPKARVIAAIDTLTYLQRGGRIGKAQALLGSLLNVKPLITLKDGEVQPLGRARSRAQALDRLVQLLERDGAITHLAILHGGARADAERLRERVAPHYPGLDISFAETGPVLGTHTGPGVIGFTYLVK
ncbi:MAG TPA: DegV family protein [Candidatus Limnocylindrales bacterium]|nr:DegV family protein [Candidatus Limnocylindrales bacterium]